MRPYIGITGIVTADDVETARQCAALVPPSYRLMTGILVSAKTLRGEATTSRRYPAVAVAATLAHELVRFAWPVVHYNTRGADLEGELATLLDVVPELCGIQLNVVRPDTRAVAAFKDRHPDVAVILQANGASLPARTQPAIADYVSRYPSADYALVDLSGGSGRPINTALARNVLLCWSGSACPAIAGGLGPGCTKTLQEIGVQFRHNVSVDAESGVRVPVADPLPGEKHQDRLDRQRALEYVNDAVAALCPREEKA